MKILQVIWEFYVIGCITFTTLFLVGLIRHLRVKLKENDKSELVEQLQNHIKVVYVEQVCGMYHLYDKINNSFIAQGYTEDEMWYNAHLTFPKKDFIIEGENGKAVLVNLKDKK